MRRDSIRYLFKITEHFSQVLQAPPSPCLMVESDLHLLGLSQRKRERPLVTERHTSKELPPQPN